MRKSALFMPLAAIIAGAFGFALRTKELDTVFDSATGLAERFDPVTVALIVFSLFMTAVFVVFSLCVMKKNRAANSCAAIAPPAGGMLLVYVIIALFMFAGAALLILESEHNYGKLMTYIFALFAVLTGAAYIAVPFSAAHGKNKDLMCGISVMPAIFYSLWLVAAYRESAADPVLLNYYYECLALSALALSSYYYAGFAFSKAVPSAMLVTGLVSIYLCILILADSNRTPITLMLISACMAQTANTAVLLFRLEQKR